MGVKMVQPSFQLRDLVEHKGLVCLSPNFELYGDMSDRMMSLAAGLGPLRKSTASMNHSSETWTEFGI